MKPSKIDLPKNNDKKDENVKGIKYVLDSNLIKP